MHHSSQSLQKKTNGGGQTLTFNQQSSTLDQSSGTSLSGASHPDRLCESPNVVIKKSFLTDEVFTEDVDVRILGALLNHASELLINNSDWNEEIMLKKMLKHVKKGTLRVQYIHSKGGVKDLGRVNAKGLVSLGALRREIRGSLTTGKYIDIDIVNAHPNIIHQLLQRFGLSNTSYANYCANREDCLERVMKHHHVNRNDAKTLFITIGYGGSYEAWRKNTNAVNAPLPFVREFQKESKALAQTFIAANSKLYAKYCKLKPATYNYEHGFLSTVIQNIERRILEKMYTFFRSKKLITNNNCVLCHDGIMLRAETLPEGVLDELAAHIHEVSGFKLVWKDKPMEHYLERLTFETIDEQHAHRFEANYFKSISTYELKKDYFERFVCKVNKPQPAYVVMDTFEDKLGEKSKVHIYSDNEIRIAYKQYNEDSYGTMDRYGRATKFIDRWLRDEDMKVYERMDFLPYNDVKRAHAADATTFNLFTGYNSNIKGFPCAGEERMRIIQPFLNIVIALCEGNALYADFVMKFVAQIVRQPMKKLPIAIILKGKQGTGKSLFIKVLSNLLGSEHVFSSSKASDFLGEHAEGCVNKLVININEANQQDSFHFEGMLKSLISEDTLRINAKYLRPFDVMNWARIFITTNKPNGVQIDFLSGDRRWMMFTSSDTYLDKKYTHQFWSKMFAHIDKPKFIAALYQHLNDLDIESYDFAKMRKKCLTKSYYEAVKRSVPYQAQFMEAFVNQFKYGHAMNCFNCFSGDAEEEHTRAIQPDYAEQRSVVRTEVFSEYKRWLKQHRPNCAHNQSARNFYATLIDLEMPLVEKKTCGIRQFVFVPQEVYQHLLQRQWTERDANEDDEVATEDSVEECLDAELAALFEMEE